MAFNFKKRAQFRNADFLNQMTQGTYGLPANVDAIKAQYLWNNVYQNNLRFNSIQEMASVLEADGIDREYANMSNPEVVDNVKQPAVNIQNVTDQLEDVLTSTKSFNLKKQAQIPMQQMAPPPPQFPDPADYQAEQMDQRNQQMDQLQQVYQPLQFNFADHNELKNYLDQKGERGKRGFKEVIQDLSYNKVPDLKEAIEYYYKIKKDAKKGAATPEDLLDYVNSDIYKLLPDNLTSGGVVLRKNRSEVLDAIKKLAEKNTKKKEVKSFNMSKTAQHKTQENVIMYGPEEVRKVDPFLRQPVSDWHIVERNKGFGLVVDDVWNIDYETIWRENIMDKYYRPYKDKEGNWVGGYIQKRFEVDKNIPASSNLQLKPGQTRRPILSEYGNTESRLQAARAAGDIAGANDISKPFNWKEASSKKKSLIK